MPRTAADLDADANTLASYLSPYGVPVNILLLAMGWDRGRLTVARETLAEKGVTTHFLIGQDTLKASPETMYECRELGRTALE